MGASRQIGHGAAAGAQTARVQSTQVLKGARLGSYLWAGAAAPKGVAPALLLALALAGACRGPLMADERERTWQAAERASRSGDWTSAASLWNEIRLGDASAGARPCAETARALLALDKTDDALALVEASVERFPEDAELRALRAQILNQLGFPRAAEAELLAATRLAPDEGRYWLQLSAIQLELSSPQSAAQSLLQAERCAGLAPQSCDPARLALLGARSARSRSSFDEAQERYHRAVELALVQPSNPDQPLRSPGLEPGELPENPTPIELLVEAASLYTAPDSPAPEPAVLSLALSWSSSAAEQDPQFVCAHFVQAVLLERAGRSTEALTAYRRAVEVDGHHLGATTNMALLCRQMGRWGEAQGLFERALLLEKDPERRAKLSAMSAENSAQQTAAGSGPSTAARSGP